MLSGAAPDRNLMRQPVPIDLAECERAAVDLHLGAQIILHYRTPGLERLRSQFAIFLGFSGATDATREDARHTLRYRLIDDAQAFADHSPNGTVEGSCGSVLTTMAGLVIGIHSSGPDDKDIWTTVGGQLQEVGNTGFRTRVGGRQAKVNLRKHVEKAHLTTLDSYLLDRAGGMRADSYENGISIFAIRRSFEEWGLQPAQQQTADGA